MVCEGLEVLACEGEVEEDEGVGAEGGVEEGGEGGEGFEDGQDWCGVRGVTERLFMREVRVGQGVIEVGNVGFRGMRCVGKGK